MEEKQNSYHAIAARLFEGAQPVAVENQSNANNSETENSVESNDSADVENSPISESETFPDEENSLETKDEENSPAEKGLDSNFEEESEKEEESSVEDLIIPGSLNKESKKLIESVKDPIAKKAFIDLAKSMQAKVDKTIVESQNKLKEVNQFSEEFNYLKHVAREYGYADTAEVIKTYTNLERNLAQDPNKFILELARKRGIDLSRLAETQNGQVEMKYESNIDLKRMQEIARQEAEIISEKKYWDDKVKQFRTAKDNKGELVNPYFDRLKVKMGQLLDMDPNYTLEVAYKKAILLDDEIAALEKARLATKIVSKPVEKPKQIPSKTLQQPKPQIGAIKKKGGYEALAYNYLSQYSG